MCELCAVDVSKYITECENSVSFTTLVQTTVNSEIISEASLHLHLVI